MDYQGIKVNYNDNYVTFTYSSKRVKEVLVYDLTEKETIIDYGESLVNGTIKPNSRVYQKENKKY